MCVCVRVCVRGRNHGNYLEKYVLPNHCWQIFTMLCKIVLMRCGDGFTQEVQIWRGSLLFFSKTCCDWRHRGPLWRGFQIHVQLFVVVHKTCWGKYWQAKKKENTDSLCATMYYEINKSKFAKIKASAFWKNGFVKQRRGLIAVTSTFVFINQ